MFKVIIHAEDLKRNFDYYTENTDLVVFPKYRNFPYIKNGKVLHFIRIDEKLYSIPNMFEFKEFNEKTMKLCSSTSDIRLLFEFETEEEAFYFKMKYC